MDVDNNKRKDNSSISSAAPTTNKRLKTLVIPKRVKRTTDTKKGTDTKKEDAEKLREDIKAIANTRLLTKDVDYYECSLCGEKLMAPYPRPLKRLIAVVRKNEHNYRKEQEEQHKVLVEQCKKDGTPIPRFTFVKGGISKNDQNVICRMHKVELVLKPLGLERGYPTTIEFEKIDERAKAMKKDLQHMIDRKKDSVFLEKVLEAHKKLGSVKARQTVQLINRFSETLPGYYGNRGSHYIMETLNEMFIKTNILDKEKSNPLTPIEFIQQVLVPEVGSRLIMEDMKLDNLDKAIKVMEESSEYGSVIYNKIKK